MQQILIDFGVLEIGEASIPLRVYGYGLMLVLGFVAAVFLAQWRARRMGENPDTVAYTGLIGLIGGVAGARIAYIIENWSDFADAANPLGAMLNITSGGLIYYGGVVLGMGLALGYMFVKKIPVRRYLDIIAVPIMVGLAFGRMGCLLNGCCYGGPAREDWALSQRFPMYSKPLLKLDGRENPYSLGTEAPTPPYAGQLADGRIVPSPELVSEQGRLLRPRQFDAAQCAIAGAEHSRPVQPAQALGIVNALVIAGILMAAFRLRTREGQIFAFMVLLYPITRFVLESIRADNEHDLLALQLTHNQYTSLAIFALGLAMLLGLRWLPAAAGPVATAAPTGPAEQAGPARRRPRHKRSSRQRKD